MKEKEILVWVGDAWRGESEEEEYTLEYLEQCNKAMWDQLLKDEEEEEEE